MATVHRRRGEVASFDAGAGWGVVRDGDGRDWQFHCTAIADGTRAIEVGAVVTFDVVAGLRGLFEARDLQPA